MKIVRSFTPVRLASSVGGKSMKSAHVMTAATKATVSVAFVAGPQTAIAPIHIVTRALAARVLTPDSGYKHLEALRDDIESQVRKWGPEGEGVKELRAKIEAELKAWGPQIRSLQVAADKAEAEAKRLIQDLKAKEKSLEARLGEVKQAGGSAWEDVKTGAGKAWEELRPAIQSAIARFK